MADTYFRVPVGDVSRTAPRRSHHRGLPAAWRGARRKRLRLGGVAGHAGLFSSAADLSVFAQMLLNGGSYNGVRVIADSTVTLFTRRAAGHRALGWDTCDEAPAADSS